MSKARARKKTRTNKTRRRALLLGAISFCFLILWSWLGVWFVHHSPAWLAQKSDSWPTILTAPLFWIGNPVGDMTDALGWTGTDVVYEYDEEAPSGEITFAGIPLRIGAPAPQDIRVLDRGDFYIGWSPSLRHPVWVAYHVPVKAAYEVGERPNFTRDAAAPQSPTASDYKNSGYDRGHMAPNYAITSRFGADVQKKTFLMSNIAPQSPALNRGVWREVEHRIAELWTARWGEIWVIVGCVPSENGKKIGKDGIDVPDKFYQVVVAQEGYDVRAFAVLFDQDAPWKMWPTRALVTIDELEEVTGLDFLADLPDFIERPLESSRPTRLWPVRPLDLFKQLALRFISDY